MAAFVIPSIFTAIDRISAPMQAMTRNVQAFAQKAEIAVSRSERMFRKLTPTIGEAGRQFLSFASSAAIAASIAAGGTFSVKKIMDYQTEIQSLSAITGAGGAQLDLYKDKIRQVSTETKESSVEVAKAFTMIGNNQPQLLQDAAALAEVTKQSIILAQASRMQLGPASDYLTTIMNQFGLQAMQSKSVIDLLAGGMVIGSTDIDKVSDAMVRFGAVANQVSGVKLPEAVTAIEAISDKLKDPEKIGTSFRNMFLIMSNIKGQDPKAMKDLKATGVNMDIVASKTTPLIAKLNELKKLNMRPGALEHVFGKENMQAIVPLLASTDKYVTMLEKLTTSTDAQDAAQKMANKNNDTLRRNLDQMINKYVTLITTSDHASSGLRIFSKVIQFVTNHMEGILTVIVAVVAAFSTWLAIMILTRMALLAYNIVLAITGALTGSVAISVGSSSVALGVYNAVTWLAADATGAFAVALGLAGLPIWLIALAIVALIALIVVVIKYFNEWGAAVALIIGPIGWIINLIQSFRRNWDMLVESFHRGGLIEGIKAIGNILVDSFLMPLQQILKIIHKIPGFEWAGKGVSMIEKVRSDHMGLNTSTDESGNALPKYDAINIKQTQNDALAKTIDFRNQSSLFVNIKDEKNRTDAYSPDSWVTIKTTPTR